MQGRPGPGGDRAPRGHAVLMVSPATDPRAAFLAGARWPCLAQWPIGANVGAWRSGPIASSGEGDAASGPAASSRFALPQWFDSACSRLVPSRQRVRWRARELCRRGRLSINPKSTRVEAADLVVLVGGRMSEAARKATRSSAFLLPGSAWLPSMQTRASLAENYHPALGIVATSPEFCAALEGVEP